MDAITEQELERLKHESATDKQELVRVKQELQDARARLAAGDNHDGNPRKRKKLDPLDNPSMPITQVSSHTYDMYNNRMYHSRS